MRIITIYLSAFLLLLITQQMTGQEDYKRQIEKLKDKKEQIAHEEKEALKEEVRDINDRMDNGDLSEDEAKLLKAEVAKKRALNIENRVAIIDNQIAILERNKGRGISILDGDTQFFEEDGFSIRIDGEPIFIGNHRRWEREVKYDRRTYSDPVFAIGLNNAIIEGESLDNSPYKIGGSRFFEMGWQWRTRVFKNSNWLRFNYGFSFQFNGLKPDDNQVFVQNGDQTELEDFEFELDKAKLRMDNLVFPVHFEFGPSKFRKTEKSIRYSIHNQFRMGIGGYGGFNLGTRQKLKYSNNGENIKDKLKRDYNTSDLIYGLSAYIGVDEVLLYVKYDLNPIFKDAVVEQRNISLGLRFDL